MSYFWYNYSPVTFIMCMTVFRCETDMLFIYLLSMVLDNEHSLKNVPWSSTYIKTANNVNKRTKTDSFCNLCRRYQLNPVKKFPRNRGRGQTTHVVKWYTVNQHHIFKQAEHSSAPFFALFLVTSKYFNFYYNFWRDTITKQLLPKIS